jgi:hypothetical protein
MQYKVLVHLRHKPSHTPIVFFDSASEEIVGQTHAITELVDFHLELRTQAEGVSIEVDLGEDVGTFALSSEIPWATVYEYGMDYPWRCGVFQFAVRDGGEMHAGLIEIVPKNVSLEQFQLIHKVVNARVNGLVYDFFHVRQVGTMFSPDLEQYSPWQFFAWYRTVERELLHAIQQIELRPETDIQVDYQVEAQQKGHSRKSLMWQMMRPLAAVNQRFLNRKVRETTDCLSNQMAKTAVQQILMQVQANMEQLSELYVQSEAELQQERQPNIRRRLQVLQQFTGEYERLYHSLNDLINRPFWRTIGKVNGIRGAVMRSTSYQRVFQIWEQAVRPIGNQAGDSIAYGPTLRTTDQIYEYYVFFSLVEVFEQLGNTIDEDRTELSYFGLSDGTSVYLNGEKGGVRIAFNEEIASDHFKAIQAGGGFYSYEPNRKPDIRIDLFDREGTYRRTSCIFEVKYRPLHNIYSRHEVQDAMKQMGKYWAIGHVDAVGSFTPRVVHGVYCIYPGDERADTLVHGPQGDFVQYYPLSETEDFGRETVTTIIQTWLHQHQQNWS